MLQSLVLEKNKINTSEQRNCENDFLDLILETWMLILCVPQLLVQQWAEYGHSMDFLTACFLRNPSWVWQCSFIIFCCFEMLDLVRYVNIPGISEKHPADYWLVFTTVIWEHFIILSKTISPADVMKQELGVSVWSFLVLGKINVMQSSSVTLILYAHYCLY